ncbi:hypothetical protein Landi51_08453 [Colletotrichum acutatum]
MGLLHELESMAMTQQDNTEPDCDDIKRWQSRFGYTFTNATQKIQDHRSNFARVQVSEFHWDMVRAEKESQGHGEESYDTRADPTVLIYLPGIEPVDRAAKGRGGCLATWGGKYKALVDASAYEKSCVDGHAFLVTNKDQEDALQLYETENYEVVRCVIEFMLGGGRDEEVRGLTFRFIGETDA